MKKMSRNKTKDFFKFFMTYELHNEHAIYRLIFSLTGFTKKLHSELLLTQISKNKVSKCNFHVEQMWAAWRLTPF